MSFDSILNKLIDKVPGSVGAVFVDYDGEEICHYPHDDRELMRLYGAYQGIVFNLVRSNINKSGVGVIEEVVIEHRHARFLLRPIHNDYLLVLVLSESALSYVANNCANIAVGELIDEIGPM
jgi:predicted regulator of Ras-like GTPase activity (Roadblock/LC7/MglB family)